MRPKLKGAETAVFAVIRDLDESQPRALRGLYEGRLRSRQEEVEVRSYMSCCCSSGDVVGIVEDELAV